MNALPGENKSSLQLQKNAAAPVSDAGAPRALASVYGTGFSGRDPPVIVGGPIQCGPSATFIAFITPKASAGSNLAALSDILSEH